MNISKTTILRLASLQIKKVNLLLISLLILLSGCAEFNGTPLEGVLGGDHDIIHLAYTIADDLEENAYPPLIPRHPEQPVLLTTFVNNNDLQQTSHFSRILQENITSRFVQHGYTVREIKMRKNLQVRQREGETILSRDLKEIRSSQSAQAIAVGTYSITNRTLYISARLINPENANILSSTDHKLVMGKEMLAMFGLQFKPQDEMDLVDEPEPSFITKILY